MDDAATFIHAIHEHPEDDGPRLVFADWLEERPDTLSRQRGEFIRLQCALSKLPADDPRRPALADRERNLLDSNEAAWMQPLRGIITGWHFRRGFVEEVTIEARRLLARGEELFRAAPVRHIRLLDAGSVLASVAACPLLGKLRALTIFAHHLGDRLARTLAGSPYLGRLAVLNLARNRLSDLGAEVLAQASSLAGLTGLIVSDNLIGEPGACALAASPHLGRLASLDLHLNRVGAGGVAALLSSTRLGRLASLDLGGNHLGAGPLRPIAAALPTRLRALRLADNVLTVDHIRELMVADNLPALHHLDLGGNPLGDAGAAALADSPGLAGLRSLRLRRCLLSDVGVAALAGSPHLAGLQELDLLQNPTGTAGTQALVDSPYLRRLELLTPGNVLSPRLEHALRARGIRVPRDVD